MKTFRRAVCAGVCLLAGVAQGQVVWDGDSGGAWTVGGNWVGGIAPEADDSLQFSGANVTNHNDFVAGTAFAGIDFAAGAGAFTLRGNSIALGGNIVNNSTTPQTIDLDMALGATRTVTTTAGDIIISGNLSGEGGLSKGNSGGTLTLAGTNSFTGRLWVQRDVVSIHELDGNGTDDIWMGTGYRSATLQYTGSGERTTRGIRFSSGAGQTHRIDQNGSGTLEFSGTLSQAWDSAGYTFALGGSGSGVYSGIIDDGTDPAGQITVLKDGRGVWTLMGTNRYLGGTMVNDGTLRIDGDNRAATGTVTVARAATLAGLGLIGGDVVLEGTLRPGGALPGTLSISGGLTSDSRSEVVFRIDDPTCFDRLAASGGVELNGQVTVSLDPGYSPAAGDTFDLVSGAISGTPVLELPALTEPGLAWDTSRFASHGEVSIIRDAGPDVRYAFWLGQDPSLSGPDTLASADPHGTGHSNLARYFFGGAPSADGLPVPPRIAVEGDEAVVRFVGLRSGSDAAEYKVLSSTNLVMDALEVDAELSAAIEDDPDQSGVLRPGDYVRRRFSIPVTQPGFFRIRAVDNLTDFAAPGQDLQLDTGTWTVDFPIPYSSSGGSLTVTGSGTLILSADNTHTGSTTVNGGTLLVDGDSSGATGDVHVASGAVLGGSGTLGGAVYLAEGARFRADATLSADAFSFGGFTVRDIDGLDPDPAPGTYPLITGNIDTQNIQTVGRENSVRIGDRRLWFELAPDALLYHVEMDIDVTAYGAVPDDGQDDAAAFEASLNDIISRGGGTLRVPPGNYDFASRRVIDLGGAAIEIRGHGKGVSVLRGNNSDGVWWFNNSYAASALAIQDLTFAPNNGGNAGTALEVDNPALPTDPDLSTLEMRSVDFQPTDSLVDYFQVHVRGAFLQNARFDDVFIRGVRGSEWDGDWKLAEYGFDLSDGDGAAFVNCYSKNNQYGFWLSRYRGAVVFDRSNAVQNHTGMRVAAPADAICTVDVLHCHINTFVRNLKIIRADRLSVLELASYVQNEIPNPDTFKDIVITDSTDVSILSCAFNQPFALNRVQIDLIGSTQGVLIQGNVFNGHYWNGTGNTVTVDMDAGVSDVDETQNLYPPEPQW
ncbi:autotransporter-associated beta strand repeat-containing protein [Kiritimatiella glycovorans]|uniref:autotransporter-associated beta strand repeat-containing protein n=1 Tax=Kiritimatiella glycovorans TaxID=1307763 RepID=UPI0011874D8E|nr:autotransporter-associated beta strand repeat-containing protein [Kiritimatiella glycovorans]